VRIEEFEARTQRSSKCFRHSNALYERFSVWKNCLVAAHVRVHQV